MFEFGQKLVKKLVEILKRPSRIRRKRGLKRPSLRKNLFQHHNCISAEKMAEGLGFSKEEANALFTSPPFSFPKNKHAALREIQEVLGLDDEKLMTLFSLFEEADDGWLGFHFGIINIEFQTSMYSGRFENEDEITVRVELQEKEATQIVEYRFPRGSGDMAASKEKP